MSEYKPRKGEADEKRRADEAHAKAKGVAILNTGESRITSGYYAGLPGYETLTVTPVDVAPKSWIGRIKAAVGLK